MDLSPASASLVAEAFGHGGRLEADTVSGVIVEALGRLKLSGCSVVVAIPDATRSAPLPLLVKALGDGLSRAGASKVTLLVALGTHAPMSTNALWAHVGLDQHGNQAAQWGFALTVENHRWWEPDTFAHVGRIPAERLAQLSEGRLALDVEVRVNRAVTESDLCLIVGPVLPHEVVGFSGGNKYLFPGLSGPEMIDVSHWLGALIGSSQIIGTPGITPVRALIDEAAALTGPNRLAVCVVTAPERAASTTSSGLQAVCIGSPEVAWAEAAAVTAQTHIRYLDAPVDRVLSLVSERYDDLWTGAKGFYKVEPVVADGGLVVLHAPHITEVAAMHPGLRTIGYHCRDYFLGQWERFSHLPWGELAHSTHLRGAGTWDPVSGEHPRVRIALATSIPQDEVIAMGLEYLDPRDVDVTAWSKDPAALVVHDAGEDLYRLRSPS